MAIEQPRRERDDQVPRHGPAAGPAAQEGRPGPGEAGGEAACWSHLLCPDCGAVSGEEHSTGCGLAPPPAAA